MSQTLQTPELATLPFQRTPNPRGPRIVAEDLCHVIPARSHGLPSLNLNLSDPIFQTSDSGAQLAADRQKEAGYEASWTLGGSWTGLGMRSFEKKELKKGRLVDMSIYTYKNIKERESKNLKHMFLKQNHWIEKQ